MGRNIFFVFPVVSWLIQGIVDPLTSGGCNYTLWYRRPELDPRVPVLAFTLRQTEAQLAQTCVDQHLDADACSFLAYRYQQGMSFAQRVVARNPRSRLLACANCTAADGNAFLVDQNENIPWFVDTLMAAVAQL